ncbi:MAG: hypothetical protein KDK39_10270 [Leptospiraceae bacterium]|nr:hypothetical protein [Leptospiraceae bacterium]
MILDPGQRYYDPDQDRELHITAMQALRSGAGEGDVLPVLIQHNVPNRILGQFWPELLTASRAASLRLAFAAAEDGWRGRIENLESRCLARPDGQSWQITMKKSHVIACDRVIGLLRAPTTENSAAERLALLALDLAEPGIAGIHVSARQEPGLRLPCSQSAGSGSQRPAYVGHSRLEADLQLTMEQSGQLQLITSADYKELGQGIPAWELSSMALMAMAVLEHHGLRIDAQIKAQMDLLLQARSRAGGTRRLLVQARAIWRYFFHQVAQKGITVHPFWQQVARLL